MVGRAAHDRYDGRLRIGLAARGYSGNPFGDDECGKFYARAMSVWSLLLASQGFIHDGPAGVIGFAPRWLPQDHRSFFTAAEGWGLFTQRRRGGAQTETIELRGGRLRVKTLVFEAADVGRGFTSAPDSAGMGMPALQAGGASWRPKAVTVTIAGRAAPASLAVEGQRVTVSLSSARVVRAGEAMEVALTGFPG